MRAPKHLDAEGKREWKRMINILHPLRLVTEADRALLTAYCETWSRLVEAQKVLRDPLTSLVYRTSRGDYQKNPWVTVAETAGKELRAFASEFGLSPSARTRISVEPEKSDDEYEAFLKRGRAASG